MQRNWALVYITLTTGTASEGKSGSFYLETGYDYDVVGSPAGAMVVHIGTKDIGNAGSIALVAGRTEGPSSVGGFISVVAGIGASNDDSDGGNGGIMQLFGGEAFGGAEIDVGGSVYLHGGSSASATGGKRYECDESCAAIGAFDGELCSWSRPGSSGGEHD